MLVSAQAFKLDPAGGKDSHSNLSLRRTDHIAPDTYMLISVYQIGTFRVGALLDAAARGWANDTSACNSGQEDMVRLTVSSGAALYIEDQRTW